MALGTGTARAAMGGTVGPEAAPCPRRQRSPRRAGGCLGLSQPAEQVNLGLPDTWNKIAIP